VQVLTLDTWNGRLLFVQDYAFVTGTTHPVLRDASLVLATYDLLYENYVVVDPTGIVRYSSEHEVFINGGRWHDDTVRAAISANLPGETPVESISWGAIKALY